MLKRGGHAVNFPCWHAQSFCLFSPVGYRIACLCHNFVRLFWFNVKILGHREGIVQRRGLVVKVYGRGKLVALVPKPRVNLTRLYGVFAPYSKHRVRVTLAKQEEAEGPAWVEGGDKPPSQSWFRFWSVSEYSMGINLRAAFLCTRPQD
jgi:hypothetical protein